jgi:cytochrome c-type biogenesis protein CcmH/NrfG
VTEIRTTTSNSWSSTQAFAAATFSLLLGVCGGWVIRRSFAAPAQTITPVGSPAVPAEAASQTAPPNFSSLAAPQNAQDLKQAADAQATPLLEQLRADPTNAGLLAQLGNTYYDAKQYPKAIDYYERSLKSQPSNSFVRTDLGTAYWYNGDADTAIAEFSKVLTSEPNKADTLFNLGVVKWQGKKDGQGAVAAWQRLLDTNPGYANKDSVLQLIAQVQKP